MREREPDNSLPPSDMTRDGGDPSEVQFRGSDRGVRKIARVFVGDSIVRKTDIVLKREMTW